MRVILGGNHFVRFGGWRNIWDLVVYLLLVLLILLFYISRLSGWFLAGSVPVSVSPFLFKENVRDDLQVLKHDCFFPRRASFSYLAVLSHVSNAPARDLSISSLLPFSSDPLSSFLTRLVT